MDDGRDRQGLLQQLNEIVEQHLRTWRLPIRTPVEYERPANPFVTEPPSLEGLRTSVTQMQLNAEAEERARNGMDRFRFIPAREWSRPDPIVTPVEEWAMSTADYSAPRWDLDSVPDYSRQYVQLQDRTQQGDNMATTMNVFGITPAYFLEPAHIQTLKTWLIGVLQGRDMRYPFSDVPVIYLGNKALKVVDGAWQIEGDRVYVGRRWTSPNVSALTRMQQLAVIAAIAATARLNVDEEVQREYSKALATALMADYEGAVGVFIQSQVNVTRLAMKHGVGVAGWQDGAWYSPTGEPVEVDASWTLIAV